MKVFILILCNMCQSKSFRHFLSQLQSSINHRSTLQNSFRVKFCWSKKDWEPCSYFNRHIISQVDMHVVLFTFLNKIANGCIDFLRENMLKVKR